MITRYQYGRCIHTGAVVEELPVREGFPEELVRSEDQLTLKARMEEDEVVYGLGEQVRGLNKRGWIYVSDNADEPNHYEDKRSLYASHNLLILASPKRKGVRGYFFDVPGRVTFDIGFTKKDELAVILTEPFLDLYVLEEDSLPALAHAFRGLVGRSYIPPFFAFGFGQSRWGYRSADEIREVARNYKEAGFPIDMIYLDIDYMEAYKDFTVNKETFPDLPGLVREMKEEGIRLVPIIDAGVKIEEGYDVYEEGVEKGYFVRDKNGKELVAAVWPGRVHFPDFLNDEAALWFGRKYRFLTDQGIEGFWNDMNEPAIFYTEDHLQEVFEKIEDFKGKNLDIYSFFAFKGLVGTLDNNESDYRRFYHRMDGENIRHDRVHNLFGFRMTKAAADGLKEIDPSRRFLLFSRASFIGMHRYAGVWTGDNKSIWSHILLALQQVMSLNMAGFLYCGPDTGGFGADASEELMQRFTALTIFTPLFRNHAAMGTRRQEYYQLGDPDEYRGLVELRYRLLPYLYSEFMKAALRNGVLFAPLSFAWPEDERAYGCEDQALVGGQIMIAPVYVQNAKGRYVYLPEEMRMVLFAGCEVKETKVLPAGDHYLSCFPGEVLVFVRKGGVLPLGRPVHNTSEVDCRDLEYICFEADPSDYELYTDDGISTAFGE